MEFRLGAMVWADAPIAASVMHRTAANILRRRSIGLSSLNLSGGSIRRAAQSATRLDYRRPPEGTNRGPLRGSYVLRAGRPEGWPGSPSQQITLLAGERHFSQIIGQAEELLILFVSGALDGCRIRPILSFPLP